MYKNKTYLLPILLLWAIVAQAQQLPLYTQYRDHQSLINPASLSSDYIASGYELSQSIGLSYRYQWANLKDAPRTMSARYENVLEDYNMLFGLSLTQDETGPTGASGAYLRYAYQAYFSRDMFLSMGVSAGVMQYRFQGSKGVLRDAGDVLGESDTRAMLADVNIGLSLSMALGNGDILYGGLSVPQLLASQINVNAADYEFQSNRQSHYYATVGMYKYLENRLSDFGENMFIEPSLWLKYTPNAPLQTDFNVRFQMSELFWIGTGYSISLGEKVRGNHVHLETGFVLGDLVGFEDKRLKIGYGFDRALTVYGPKFGSTHELSLMFAW